MALKESGLNQHLDVFGGYWKCEDCGLIIEDELFSCPECNSKKPISETVDDLDSYVGVGGITLDQQEEMLADEGYAKKFGKWQKAKDDLQEIVRDKGVKSMKIASGRMKK